MNKSIGYIVACVLGLGGCTIERYDDDCEDYDYDYVPDKPTSPSRAGSGSASGGAATGGAANGGSASGGAASGGAGAATVPASCNKERDCAPGFNCDLDAHECVASAAETCPELDTEAACTNRRDCMPIYGGTNCSCGQDCECRGGEPGCVCESFQFFVCESVP